MTSSEEPQQPVEPSNPDMVYFPLSDEQRDAIERGEIERGERFIPGPAGAPDVPVVVTRPGAVTRALPVLMHIHGGGFTGGHPESFPGTEVYWASQFDCAVVSVDYRLAPEHRFPAGIEDCYAALRWTAASRDELSIDPDHLVVAGESAGGALAAALCLMARDRNGPPITFQALQIPVLDDRLDQPSYAQAEGGPGFNSAAARDMWEHYLGEDYDRSATSPYAAPMRAKDLSGLPPTFIQTAGLDPLRDEGIQYAMRLMAEGIDVELYNAPGNSHSIDPMNARTAGQARRVYSHALGAALSRK
ncbi:MAG: alpha/beta hydrolase [Acidimicrobiia bacterium]|nr:alpha/beta hydrolase [Acidimicrobiia bacterium]